MDEKHEALSRYFGYSEFRSGQETLIDALLSGRDALGILPTGGGKSICYQLPALLLEGVTLVISPLISLMQDQVAALTAAGVAGAYINSSLSWAQTQTVYRRCVQGAYRIVYVAPERLLTEEFLAAAEAMHIAMVAVDEAHCISQWGQDFRPSYLKITQFLDRLPVRPPVAAFTATATCRVREDIVTALCLRDPETVITGFDRPNLRFEVLRPAHKRVTLLKLLEDRREDSGIVYCSTRREVERVCELLREKGYAATRYHAGLPEQERRENQDDFIYDRARVMVATNAFGMGIDKSNVSFVIHYNMPKSLEAYYQEAGRAGRDGTAADCILLYSDADVRTAKMLIQEDTGREDVTEEDRAQAVERDLERLQAMLHYCRTGDCLRGCILDYFGQEHQARCGNCGSCSGAEEQDLTRPAQMALSCVKRIRDRLGYALGAAMVVKVLRGSRETRLTELGLDELSTYGLMKDQSRQQVSELLSILEDQGYLLTENLHSTVRLTRQAGEVLFRGKRVMGRLRSEKTKPERQQQPAAALSGPVDEKLLAALKALRYKLAQEEQVPAYIVFTNATLADMAARQPRTEEELLEVSGVGARKAERYGTAFLEEIRSCLGE